MSIITKITNKRDFDGDYSSVKKVSKTKSKFSANPTMAAFSNSAVLYAFVKYQEIIDGRAKGSVAIDSSGRYLVEYITEDMIECSVYNPSTGKLMAAKYDQNENTISYDIDNEDGSLIILSIIECVLQEQEARHAYEQIQLGISDVSLINDLDDFSLYLALLSDNILSRLKVQGPDCIKNDLSSINSIMKIPLRSIKAGSYDVETEIFGMSRMFRNIKVKHTKEIKPQDFNGRYRFSNEEYEKEKIAYIDDTYLVPEEIVNICKYIKESSNMNPPFRSVLLYGESGSGKTDGSYAIAAGLGMPYVTYNCHPQTDNFDLIGQFVPVTGSEDGAITIKEWLKKKGLPSVEEINENPVESYKKITGKRKSTTATAADVVALLIEKMFSLIEMEKNNKKGEFVFVHSEIIEALKNGYLVEIQEPTIIINEGVLVGLNAVLAGGYITLANGEKVYRHPDSIVVFTTNTPDYAGYGLMGNSVLSRCSLVYEMNTPTIDIMVDRAIAKTKMADKDVVIKMATCISDISQKLKERGKKDGVCGFRELIYWISAYNVTGDFYETAIPTIINKATFDVSVRNEINDIVRSKSFV